MVASGEVADPEYDWSDLVGDCEALRSLVGCERWVVVGYSFGGLVGLHYARLHPERVVAVCAVSPMMVPPLVRHHDAAVALSGRMGIARVARAAGGGVG